MTNKEAVLNVLNKYDLMPADHIATAAMRMYGHKMTAAQVTGVLRPLMQKGEIGASNCGFGKNVYFLIKEKNND